MKVIDLTIPATDSGGGGTGDMLKSTYDTDNDGVVDNSELVNGLTVETAVPAGALFTDTVYDDTAIQAEVDDKVRWKGAWIQALYDSQDMIRDGSYTMIANQQTSERPAPQTIGDAYYLYDGTLIEVPVVAKQIIFGSRYFVDQAAQINGYRIDVVAGNEYDVYIVDNPTTNPIIHTLINFTANTTGWQNMALPSFIVDVGYELDIVATVHEPDGTPTVTTFNYNYTTPQNPGTPGVGVIIHATNDVSNIHINNTDSDSGDNLAFLQGMTVGDIIELDSVRWAIQSVVNNTSYMTYQVSPAVQYGTTGVQALNFETVTATPITVGEEVDYNLGKTNRGLYLADGRYSDIVPDDNQYGIDILVQEISRSAHWDTVAISDGTGSSASYVPFYEYDKDLDILDIGEVWQPISELVVENAPTGVFTVGISMTWKFDRTTDSAHFRFSTDGGTTWNEFIAEPKDKTDNNSTFYEYPFEHLAVGTLQIKTEAKKDTGAVGQFDIYFSDIWFEKKRDL